MPSAEICIQYVTCYLYERSDFITFEEDSHDIKAPLSGQKKNNRSSLSVWTGAKIAPRRVNFFST